MIAIETLPREIVPLKPHHLNRRGKLNRNKLRPVIRPTSTQQNPDGLACSQLTPAQPPSPTKSILSCVAETESDAAVSTTGKCHHRKLKSGNADKKLKPPVPGKLPRLKKKDEGRVSRKSGKSSSSSTIISTSECQRRPSLKNELIAEDGDTAKPQKKKTKSVYILEAIKPNNVLSEKEKFMRLRGHYNPQFEYDNPASEKVIKSYSQVFNKLIPQVRRKHIFVIV